MKNRPLPKIIWIMKLSLYGICLQALLLNTLLANNTNGQKSISVKEVYIDIRLQNASIKDAFSYIESKTDYKFNYNHWDINNSLRLDIRNRHISVADVLIRISKESRLWFKQVNRSINVDRLKSSDIPAVQITIEEVKISGKVIDENGVGLPGVNILAKGTSVGAITDVDGNYEINVPDGINTLIFSYIGYNKEEVEIGDQTVININMYPDIQALSEIVVVGYGTQERANVTSAIAQIKSQSFEDIPVSSVEQGIASQLAGVNISQVSGGPGQPSTINIRGVGTITAGSRPLIVLDGLPLSENTSLNTINPNDIASVDVLKDAASAAIYGSRGANGVVIITTKKGESGKPKFSFNSYVGIQQVAHRLDLLNAEEHAIWDRDARNNYYLQFDDGSFSVNDDNTIREANAANLGFNPRKAIIPSYVQPYLNGQQGLTDTDWQDELFRDAIIQNYQISAAGGNDITSYFISANYFEQEGVVLGSQFDRYSLRSNIETKLSKKLKLGLNLAPTFIEEDIIPTGFNTSPVNSAVISLPYFPARNPDGSLAISQQVVGATEGDQSRSENPVAMALLNKNERSERKFLGSSYLELEIIKGLTAKTFLGIDLSNVRTETFNPSIVGTRNNAAPVNAVGRTSSSERLNWISENTLNYNTTFGTDHKFTALVGYSFQKEFFNSSQITATDFPNDLVPTLNAGIVNNGQSFSSEWALISLLGRVNYNYQGKYLLAAAIRRDGSSRFGANSKWGLFPSVSAGYRISDEAFFPQADFLSDLKLRASWGITGNNQIGDFGSQALLNGANAVLGGAIQSGLAPATSPNANLTWEETSTVDFGLDIGFLEDKLTLAIDYYSATTKDLLLQVPVPAHSGFTSSLQNIGRVRNKGIEMVLRAKYNLGPVEISSTFNIAANNNEVLELGPGQEEIINGRHITKIGGELGASYGYKTLGVFTSQQELDNTPSLSNAAIGDYIYADSNNDGVINSDDRVVLGSINPDYTFGFTSNFSFKGIDLGVVVQGVQGVTIHDRTVSVLLYNPEGWNNGAQDYFNNYYTPERGSNAVYARPNAVPSDNGFYRNTDLLHEDASFVRIRNITLGYTFPNQLTNKIGIDNLRLYASSKNPFAFTDYRGYNPEQSTGSPLSPSTGFDNYPVERSFTVGLNLNF